MSHAISLKYKQIERKQQFQEFIFIGDNSNTDVTGKTKELNLNPDSKAVNQAFVEDSLLVTQIQAAENISCQLKKLKVKPGAMVKLISKTSKGSVIISLGNKLIGLSAEIASQIAVTPAT